MGLFDSFLGNSQRRDISHGDTVFRNQITRALDDGREYITSGRDNALAAYQPFAQSGTQGFNLYADATGANGLDAQQTAFQNFESNPFLQYANQNTGDAIRNTFRAYNARGLGDSGVNREAVGQVAGNFARQDINDYLNRLSGLGNTGLGAAGAQANIHYNSGNALADFESSARSALANQGINFGNALAGSRSIGINNLIGLIGAAEDRAAKIASAGAGGA